MPTLHVLGGGPAGLALSYYLRDSEYNIQVYEKASIPGGMARSWTWDNFIVDTGPHILHTPLKNIWNDWLQLIPHEMVVGDFYSANVKRSNQNDYFFDYPLNIAQVLSSGFWSAEQRECIKFELQNSSLPDQLAKATSFAEYVHALAGDRLAEEFFTIYPEKVWGMKTTDMLPDWAPKRIRVVHEREPFFGDQFAGVSSKGTGHLFEAIVRRLQTQGHRVNYDTYISGLKQSANRITDIILNESEEISIGCSDLVVSTLPVSTISRLLGQPLDIPFRGIASTYVSFDSIKNVIPDPYHWLYFSDPSISFNRITEPTKLAPQLSLSQETRTYIICETTFDTADYANSRLSSDFFRDSTLADLKKTFLDEYTHANAITNIEPYVYPIQTHANKLLYKEAEAFLGSFANLEFLGTAANYAYNDLQVIFQQAKELSKDLVDDSMGLSSLSRSSYARFMCRSTINSFSNEESSIKPLIIAEIGINHNGSKELLYRLLDQSFESADLVKLQLFDATKRIGENVRELNHVEVAQDIDESILDLLCRCELSPDSAFQALRYISSCGKQPMCTPFDISSLELLLQWGIDNIKISSMDLNNILLHRRLCQVIKPLNIYISTGMSTLDEVKIVASMYSESPHAITFLLCNSSYPTPSPELNLLGISQLLDLGLPAGYSDHTIGLDACLTASALGASCLEVHFTDNKYQAGPDQLISKTKDDLSSLRQMLTKQANMLGHRSLGCCPSEFSTWRSQKKSLYARTDLVAGSQLTLDNTYLSSPPLGISPLSLYAHNFTVVKLIHAGSPIRFADIEQR